MLLKTNALAALLLTPLFVPVGCAHASDPGISDPEPRKVLLIGGHSVSSPFPVVHLMLEGAAEVHIATNGANNTTRSLENMDEWLQSGSWDLIYFNWGLEDIRHNRFRVDLPSFEANVQALVTKMKTSGAMLLFSTTPPVAPQNRSRVSPGTIDAYNDAALEIMASEDITVCDLAAPVSADMDTMLTENGISFSAQADLVVGEMAAQTIARALGKDLARKPKALLPEPSRKVLIIGDSISWGYFKTVSYALHGEAVVTHAEGNNQGTTHGLKEMDRWLAEGTFDVIHFNFGLHDLKHVDAEGKNARDRSAPQQADLPTYERNLEVLIGKLQATGARLIFATTTPVPPDHGPLRDPGESVKYNQVAVKLMREHGIPVNDLHSAVLPELDHYQNPADVHFKPIGSVFLGKLVAEEIRQALK